MKRHELLVALALLGACTSKNEQPKEPVQESKAAEPAKPALPGSIDEALTTSYRSQANTTRDQYRHPADTLKFFGLKPEMKLVEITPGRGWYTEILAPFLASKGQYFAAVGSDNGNENLKAANSEYTKWLADRPELKAQVIEFVPGADLKVPEPVDMIVTFRNVHNWMAAGKGKDAFKIFFKALKSGGILGVEEHRADPKKKADPKAKSGYVREADVIKFAEAAGFKLQEKSEINANPKDKKDYKDGVWTLPPTLKLGDKNKEKYLEIGESDRMTLRFVKP